MVGSDPPKSIRKLETSSIKVIGYVDDIEKYYGDWGGFVAPHRYGAGIPWKVHEAMSYGLPTVVSELIASQLGLVDESEALVAHGPNDFADKIVRLYGDEILWSKLRANSLRLIEATCNPEVLKLSLSEIIRKSLRYRKASLENSLRTDKKPTLGVQ